MEEITAEEILQQYEGLNEEVIQDPDYKEGEE